MRKLLNKFIATLLLVAVFCGCSAFTPVLPAETRQLPILMYHKVALHNPGKYVVTVDQLAQDFAAITAAGYTPVFMHEVISWVNGQGTLPAKPIVITFDDGQYNNLCYVLPLAQQYHVKYMINPVTAYSEKSMADHDTGNPRYSYLSWDEMQTAQESGLVEFGNHTHDLHGTTTRFGVAQKRGETADAYRAVLTADINHAQDLMSACGLPRPTTFAYPFGHYSPTTPAILRDLGFQALLTCNEKVNTITQGQPDCLWQLGRFNRSGHTTTAQILKKILE